MKSKYQKLIIIEVEQPPWKSLISGYGSRLANMIFVWWALERET